MNNLRKFTTEAEYTAATLNYPSVAWVTSTDAVYFDKTEPRFGDIRAMYDIDTTTGPTKLFRAEGSGSGSGSGTGGGGGFAPAQMWIDGVEVTPVYEYTFSTIGEHTVEYKLAEGETEIPDKAFFDTNRLISIELPNYITRIGANSLYYTGISAITLPSTVAFIGSDAFADCHSLQTFTCLATVPPSFENGATIGAASVIYVPAESVNDYKSASGWNDYASIIEAIP